jgi:hypothetical protein
MENVHEGTQIYYRVHRQVTRRQADLLPSTCTMRKKIRRSTKSSWTMCTKVSRSTTEFMDNMHEGKQIYYRVHGQCVRRQADLLQSSWTICTRVSRSTRVHGQCVRRQADLLQSSWTMCTKASRSTTEFMDNVYEGKQIYRRVHRYAQSKKQQRF